MKNTIFKSNKRVANISGLLIRALTLCTICLMSHAHLNAQCAIPMNHDINFSVDVVPDMNGDCGIDLTVAQFSTGATNCPDLASYAIVIDHGNHVLFDSRDLAVTLTLGAGIATWPNASDYIKKTVTVNLLALDGAGMVLNRTWGNMLVEDKDSPQIDPTPDVTIACCETTSYSPPTAQDCSGIDGKPYIVSEKTHDGCDPSFENFDGLTVSIPVGEYVKVIERTYAAKDKCGNVTKPEDYVTKTIWVRRFNTNMDVFNPSLVNPVLKCPPSYNSAVTSDGASQFLDISRWVIDTEQTNDYDVSDFADGELSLTGQDNGTPGTFINNEICYTATTNKLISFSWDASIDASGYFDNDEPSYVIKPAGGAAEMDFNLADGAGNEASGDATVHIQSGDTFCFRVRSHNTSVETTLEIENLRCTSLDLAALACDSFDPDCLDDNGFPKPNAKCGGVPFIDKAMFPERLRPTDGSKGTVMMLYPLNVAGAVADAELLDNCKMGAYMTELPIRYFGCKKELTRLWTVKEWYCGREFSWTCTQVIQIVDEDGPELVDSSAPVSFSTTTNGYTCEAQVIIPEAEFVDDCGDISKIDVQLYGLDDDGDRFPNGFYGDIDFSSAPYITLSEGSNIIEYKAYDECHNVSAAYEITVTVSDLTAPIAICDVHTSVSITYDGEADVPASVFDDGTIDDCGSVSFLARRMTPGCDCANTYPKYDDMHYLGQYTNGHHYYVSKHEFLAVKAYQLSIAKSGYNARASGAEYTWIYNQVINLKGAGVDIWLNLNDQNVDDYSGERFYVLEIEDSCKAFSNKVKFCCDDVQLDANNDPIPQMVVFRAIDKWGNFNECMVEVEVQNKFPVTMECPTDVTVNCDVLVDTEQLEDLFGTMVDDPADRGGFLIDENDLVIPATYSGLFDGYAYNNCASVSLDETVQDLRDNCGRGDILRTFTVTGTTQSCTQKITFSRDYDYLLTSITAPPVPDIIYGCVDVSQDTRISLSPDTYGKPTFEETACDLIGMNFEDDVYSFIEDQDEACAKIIRTWTIIDWCAVDDAEKPSDYSYSFKQIFKIIDLTDPVITSDCSDQVICTYGDDCAGAVLDFEMTANDGVNGCTNTANMLWFVYLLEDSDDPANINYVLIKTGSGDVAANGDALASISRTFPLGIHSLRWKFIDHCGNDAICTQEIEVVNCSTPPSYCITALSMDVGSDGAEIWASDFIAGENLLPCHDEQNFIYSFSDDPTHLGEDLTCCDAGEVIQLQIWTSVVLPDETKTYSSCNVFLTVTGTNCTEDDLDACTEMVNTAKISGKVFTERNETVEDVEIRLIGSELDPVSTDENGVYSFHRMNSGGDYVVDPKNDVEAMNGVSTLDLVLIQKHILGLQALDSPYKMIAADINMDSRVSTSDLVELRKLILGINNEFDENESWRFVSKDYSFNNPTNPLVEYFIEQYEIEGLSQDMVIDFTAVKVGDVNETAAVNDILKAELRSKDQLTLLVDHADFEEGQTISVPIYSLNDMNLLGMQFTTGFERDLVEFLGIESGSITVDKTNIGLQRADYGKLTFSWHNVTQTTISHAEPLFILNFIALKNANISDVLSVNSKITKAEAYTNTVEVMDLSLSFRDGQSISVSNKLYQNIPNPFTESTEIGFDLAKSGYVTIRVHDVTGKTITQVNGNFAKGYNQVIIDKKNIATTGVLYYTLATETYTSTKKMVILQ